MAQELRRRPNGSSTTTTTTMPGSTRNNPPGYDDSYYLGKGLAAPAMLQASPSHYGPAMKLHVPIFYTILPGFVQSLLLWIHKYLVRISFLVPTWKARYVIQLGGFLYKFVNETSKAPKGSPLAVDEMDVYLLEDLSDVDGIADPSTLHPRKQPGGTLSDAPSTTTTTATTEGTTSTSTTMEHWEGYFCIVTMRKRHYFAVSTREEALVWVNTLRQARQEYITYSMGHAEKASYPYQYFDSLASSMVRSKLRIRNQVQQSTMREMELSTMGGGGTMPRGIYG